MKKVKLTIRRNDSNQEIHRLIEVDSIGITDSKAEEEAQILYSEMYSSIIDIDDDISQECIISMVAIRNAKVAVAYKYGDCERSRELIKELEKI